MTNRMPGFEQENTNTDPITTGMFYVRPVTTSVGAGLGMDDNIASGADTNTSASIGENGNSSTNNHQSENQQTSKGSNNGLTKALVGGLIGATLGTLAAALANRRTSQGVNHAAKGVGQAAKTVGEGVTHAAQGVGQAVKSVTEGVNYAVVGGVADVVKNTAQQAQQAVAGATDAVQNSTQQGGSKEVANGEAGIEMQPETQTKYVLIPVEKERIIERTIIVEPESLVAPDPTTSVQESSGMGMNRDFDREEGSGMELNVDETLPEYQ